MASIVQAVVGHSGPCPWIRMPAKLSVATDAWARNANETSLEVIEWMKQRNFSMPGDLDQKLNQRPFSAKWISNYNTGGPIAINSVYIRTAF